jgi:tetratricopeptide (TPR) repeat protein
MAARDRGDSQGAMSVFSRSLAALVYLYQRDKRNYDNLFELGQAEFWVGYVHWDNGDLDPAAESFTRYGVITRRLLNADPKSAENVLELSYTLTNLGLVESEREGGDPEKAIRLMQAALEYNQVAKVLEPDDQHYLLEIAETQAHLADAWRGVCNLGKAYQFRSENAAIAKKLYELDPDDQGAQQRLAYSLSGNGSVQRQMGLNELALEHLWASEARLAQLAREQPEHHKFGWERLARLQRIGHILINTGRVEEAQQPISESSRLMLEEVEQIHELPLWKTQILASVWLSRSELAKEDGREQEAREFNLRAVQALAASVSDSSGFASGRGWLALALFRYWQLNNELPPARWLAQVEDYSLSEPPVRSCTLAGLAARQAVMRGDLASARFYTDYLLGKGYYAPAFIRFCQDYELCN